MGLAWLVGPPLSLLRLPRLLRLLVPKPDVLLVLAASADTVRLRKRELGRDEIERLGGAYRDLAYRSRSACVCTIVRAVSRSSTRRSTRRLRRRKRPRSNAL